MPSRMIENTKISGEDPQWLFTQYQQGSNLLIIDCRPFTDYSKAHIEGAINISVPSLMLRRLRKGNVPLKNFINSDIAKEKFDERRQVEKIILYDDQSTAECYRESSVLDFLQQKMSEDNSVALLNGGFSRFEDCFPHLCQCGEGTELNNALFSLANLSIHSDIPSPMPFRDANNNVPPKQQTVNAKDLLFRPDSLGPIEIMPRLYLGNKKDSSVLNLLQTAGITHILNVTHDLPNVYESSSEFEYLQLPIQDNWDGNMMDLFPKAFSFIDNAMSKGGCVLVHCLGGISRSSTVIIAYLMTSYNYSLNEAYDHVKSKKSNIAPNFNFMGQLLDFERSRSIPPTPFATSPGSVSPGSLSTGSEISTSSVDSADSC
ncbi:dual specificity protein phosphatase 7-like [Hydractinia symbiolongicarpus]|uniref:dual specificity protein phosphatase 7-like n=1 Tax=Hydractinia symbiolongicarpus TaxID=13093 RepID=UPI00254FAC20|nr:dual specificity protein phosphatase 7-like [Hydractinia symbiolongicarpus]